MAVVHDAFEAVVKALASTVEVEQLSGAILLRRFFDPKSEVGIGNCPYKNEVVNVIAASLRGQETGIFKSSLLTVWHTRQLCVMQTSKGQISKTDILAQEVQKTAHRTNRLSSI
jgi:hypothetical protein